MLEPPILTSELTLQLERHIAPAEHAVPGEDGQSVVRFGRTIASRPHGPWPPPAVYSFNSGDVDRLTDILAFFGNADPVFYLFHSGFDAKVGEALSAAGFYMHSWNQTILYGLPLTEPPTHPLGVTVEQVTANTIDIASEVAAEGNGWSPSWRNDAKEAMRQSIARPNFQLFLSRCHDQPAGVGDLSRSNASDRWCGLGNAAVIPHFRRTGVHRALLQHRMHIAYQSGYELVIGGADFGSTSFRNQQRVGLRMGLIETAWRRK
jgi:hypothetical protein